MLLVCPLSDLPAGSSIRVAAEPPIAVFNADGELYAVDDTCTHQDASLADGWLEGCQVECPLHASCFDLRTGKPSGRADVVCVDTDSRSCVAEDAGKRAADAVRELRAAGAQWIYKKVDSVLRGQVTAELIRSGGAPASAHSCATVSADSAAKMPNA